MKHVMEFMKTFDEIPLQYTHNVHDDPNDRSTPYPHK